MTNQPAGSSVIALEEVQAVQLPLNNKEELLKDPVFLYQIGRNLAMALHKQGITASTNASYSVKERLATHILNSEEENIFQLSTSILAHLLIFVNRKISLIKFLKLRLFWSFLHSERIQGKVGNLRLHRLEKSN